MLIICYSIPFVNMFSQFIIIFTKSIDFMDIIC